MNTDWQIPTALEYENAFRAIERELQKNAIPMLRAHYVAPQRTWTATQMAASMNYANYGAANLQYGRIGSLLCEEFNVYLKY